MVLSIGLSAFGLSSMPMKRPARANDEPINLLTHDSDCPLTPDGPRLERSVMIPSGVRAQRFELSDGQALEVDWIAELGAPRRVRFALAMPCELARAEFHGRVAPAA